ncbi:hypothetical protein C9374_004061 [Naegleria lovaniensis]|uniref:F-box domain-containing protein n=1 Tax=Naegleria lovaniensis TaxID=51637 RepID=A0AA88KL90_NAELO|nr:uncharacterized protein C9374_004061 [Naegleria lovaniensis]KAG2383390.1 hypothetical protein C9374_004061 [Naegleria lovaniensis]
MSQTTVTPPFSILEPGLPILSQQKITWNLDDYSVSESSQNNTIPCTDRLLVIPNFLSSEECSDLLDQCAKKQQFESVAAEYPQSYRNSERVIFKDKAIANRLWKLFEENLNCEDLSRNVHPFGLDSAGRWVACGVNECLRFSKYVEGNYFRPHIDGQFVRNDHERSIYTLLIYLNDDFEGGETRFMKPFNDDDLRVAQQKEQQDLTVVKVKTTSRRNREMEKKRAKMGIPPSCQEIESAQPTSPSTSEAQKHFHLLYTLKPSLGMCALFNHDLFHEGMVVTKGTKLILRTEIMFKRVDSKTVPRDEGFEKSTLYQKIAAMLNESDALEKRGQVGEATKLYISAQDLLMKSGRSMDHLLNKSYFHYKSSSYKKPNVLDYIENELTELPEEMLLHVFSFLSDKDMCKKILTLNKYFNALGRSPQLWQKIYRRNWSDDKTFGYLKQQQHRDDLEDWYFTTITRRYFEKEFVTVCIDMRTKKTMYGLFNSENEKTVESMVSYRIGGHYSFFGLHRCVLGSKQSLRPCPCLHTSGTLKDIKALQFFVSLIYKDLSLCHERHPLLCSLPPQWMKDEETYRQVLSMMMEMRIPAACMAPRHLLVAMAHQLPTCIVIEWDDCGISVSAVIDNFLNRADTKFLQMVTDEITLERLVKRLFVSEHSFIPSSITSFISGKDIHTRKQLLENIIVTGNWKEEYTSLLSVALKDKLELPQSCSIVVGNTFDAYYGAKIYCCLPDFRSKCTFWPGKE